MYRPLFQAVKIYSKNWSGKTNFRIDQLCVSFVRENYYSSRNTILTHNHPLQPSVFARRQFHSIFAPQFHGSVWK